jgi:hypothetical protein
VRRIAELAFNRKSIAPEIGHDKVDEAVRPAAAHATEGDAAPDRRELETFTLQHAMDRTALDGVRKAIDTRRSAGRLINLAASHRHPIGAFATLQMAALERDNIALMRQGRTPALTR